jgi:quercetin dioxygenase-like cupin family protein
MTEVESVSKDQLREGPGTPGIERHIAFQSAGVTVIRAHTEPGMLSGWHTHMDHDIYGYVAMGHARFEYGPEGQGTIEVGPGDFFHVPPHTVHRESNPSDEKSEILLFITGSGPLVENLDGASGG